MSFNFRIRAWDGIAKKMHYTNRYEEGSKLIFDFYYDALINDSWTYMLSTGCEDETGRDIFQGDIVIHEGYLAIVEYGKYENTFSDDCLGGTGFYLRTYDNNIQPFISDSARYKVVGNVYEFTQALKGAE